MSDRDNDPFGVFGRGERTIIRPNPGGRLPQQGIPRTPSGSPTQGAVSSSTEEWIASQRPAAAAPLPSAPNLKLEELAAPNANPIMRSAGPLLLLLGRLRVAMLRASFASLMEQVANAIVFFEKDIRSAGVPENQAHVAKYVLCATADDIVQNIPTEDRHVWTQYSMLSRFFSERMGGIKFFEELDRAKMDPIVNYPLLELQHACLALGFQGVHRTSAGGAANLQQIQRSLYETLRRVRPKVVQDLSPRWKGQELASRLGKVRVPIWAIAAVMGIVLFGFFIILRSLLGSAADATSDAFAGLHPDSDVKIARKVVAPPPPPPPPPIADQPTQLQRIRAALAAEIGARQLTADQNANTIFIRVGDLVMFEPGEDTVRPQFKSIAQRIAATLEKEPGQIKVTGHTDKIPIHNVRFPSNWDLSIARAKAVAELLKAGLSNSRRLEVEGKGADVPIAVNSTPEGRARNRRVEVTIPRAD